MVKKLDIIINKPNTHLAAEFYVLSSLYRKGISAHLTLGNHKSVDIILKRDKGEIVTIDIKGAISGDWRTGMKQPLVSKNHFYVLVNYLKKIGETNTPPHVYIIPSIKVKEFIWHSEKGGYGISYKKVRDGGKDKYLEKWELLN